MEKKTVEDIAVFPISIESPAVDTETQGFDAAATKKLLRKLDWHLIPFMSLIYLCVSCPQLLVCFIVFVC